MLIASERLHRHQLRADKANVRLPPIADIAVPAPQWLVGEMISAPVLRVARATDDLDALLPFYEAGLGLTVLYSFRDHEGFDGVMLGRLGEPYHLEFTHVRGHRVGRAPCKDNLLVFYIPDRHQWQAAVKRMRDTGFEPVPAFNPYWDRAGKTFEDADGYRVVLQGSASPY